MKNTLQIRHAGGLQASTGYGPLFVYGLIGMFKVSAVSAVIKKQIFAAKLVFSLENDQILL